MLIVCSGPDGFRALRKAQELEKAFREKYDARGFCVERVEAGKHAVDEIAARAGAMSLFAPRRFVRTANLLAESGKAQRATLKRVLAGDQETFIVVTVEDEAPTAAILKELGNEIKIVRYDFLQLQGRAFFDWALGEARVLGLTDEACARRIAEVTEGDSGSCFFELMKRAAWEGETKTGGLELVACSLERERGGVFGYADLYVSGDRRWLEVTLSFDVARQAASAFLSQARAAVRVRDGVTDGVHPFVVKKLKGKKLEKVETALARAVEGFWVQRAGYGDEEEVAVLF